MKTRLSARRSRYLAIFSVLLMMTALVAVMAGCDGNPSQDLEIQDWYDLDEVRNNLAGHHILMNDLDSTTAGYYQLAGPTTAHGGAGWQPIGVFTGAFDGQGHEIRDLFVSQPDYNRGGLFSVLYKAEIGSIGVVNAIVVGMHYIGGLAGENDQGTIENCYCVGSITGNVCVGGLVGLNEGTVSSSYFGGNITSNGHYVGGLVGQNDKGTIDNCYYNYDEVLINGEKIITVGALFDEDFAEWLANGESLDVNARLSRDDGYYVVGNVTDFKQLLIFGQDSSLKFRLASNLNLGDEPNFYIPYLAGEFDGGGHRISNLSFNFSFICQVGLFGHLASTGTVYGVAADNATIDAYERVGGLAGSSEGIVSSSSFAGSVTGGGWWVAGLVGYSLGAVSNSSSSGNVTGHYYVGGLVGYGGINSTVIDSHSSARVSASHVVGGLIGDNRGTISNSWSSGSVSGSGAVGGILGKNFGDAVDCHSTGVTAGDSDVGGLVGWNTGGTVSSSCSTGGVSGSDHVGGLVGNSDNGGTLSNCYSTGSVTGHSWVGGLVGLNKRGTVSNSYSAGSVTGATGDTSVGGLIGLRLNGTVLHSFWDIQTSGQATSDGGTGKTTAQMQDVTTFTDAGWNIIAVANPDTRNPNYIWNIVDGITYPFLSWQS